MGTRIAVVSVLLVGALAAGCSGDDSGGAVSCTRPEPANGSSPADASGADPGAAKLGGQACDVTRKQASFVGRDRERVAGSVGREDHARYTSAFVTELTRLAKHSDGCRGAALLTAFRGDAVRIDDRAGRPTPQYPAYNAAVRHGNRWLVAIGYGSPPLSMSCPERCHDPGTLFG